jgi:arginyl-tRNA synthetase
MDFQQKIEDAIKKAVKQEVNLEVPPDSSFGDYSYPCFELAKIQKQAPPQIANEIQ